MMMMKKLMQRILCNDETQVYKSCPVMVNVVQYVTVFLWIYRRRVRSNRIRFE